MKLLFVSISSAVIVHFSSMVLFAASKHIRLGERHISQISPTFIAIFQ